MYICLFASWGQKEGVCTVFFWESSGLQFQCVSYCYGLCGSYQHVSSFSYLYYIKDFSPYPHQLCAKCKFGGSLLHYAFSFQSRNCMSAKLFWKCTLGRDLRSQGEISKIVLWKRSLLIQYVCIVGHWFLVNALGKDRFDYMYHLLLKRIRNMNFNA